MKCFSNLLAIGFHRFDLDVYWDASRHVWSLCPFELGSAVGVLDTTSLASSTPTSDPTSAGSAIAVTARGLNVLSWLDMDSRWARHASSLTGSLGTPSSQMSLGAASSTALHSPSTTPTLGSITVSPKSTVSLRASGARAGPSVSNTTPGAGALINAGPYSCTSSTNLALFARILAFHLDSTETDLNATIKYLIVNLHVARSASDPVGTPNTPSPDNLPRNDQLLSSILSTFMSEYLYTAQDLQNQRANLNTTWYNVMSSKLPDSAYFHVDGHNGDTSTPNGWPSESFVEMVRAKRLFTGFGLIEPHIQDYNISLDASVIFPPGYLESRASVTTGIDGKIDSGCFFHAGESSLSSANNSWAQFADMTIGSAGNDAAQSTFSEASDLTYCGISPTLNETLSGVTADEDCRPYQEYVQSTIWSWAAGEPRNESNPNSASRTQNRCAVLNAVSGYWQTEDCRKSHFSACRYRGQPYKWEVSASQQSYNDAGVACKDGYEFTAPRTALENTYLLHVWRQAVGTEDTLLWVNFNDLDAKACWVLGQNVTCPYLRHESTQRTVLVPTISAVIVFVLAALTVFVKCAANRQRSKRRRRRGDNGWDYEGVPS